MAIAPAFTIPGQECVVLAPQIQQLYIEQSIATMCNYGVCRDQGNPERTRIQPRPGPAHDSPDKKPAGSSRCHNKGLHPLSESSQVERALRTPSAELLRQLAKGLHLSAQVLNGGTPTSTSRSTTTKLEFISGRPHEHRVDFTASSTFSFSDLIRLANICEFLQSRWKSVCGRHWKWWRQPLRPAPLPLP